MMRLTHILLCIFTLTLFVPITTAQAFHEQPLVVGWYQNPPFMEFADQLDGDVAGVDIRFVRALMEDLERPVIFRFVPESQIYEALAAGTIDVALNVQDTAKMRQVAYLTSPYRIESDMAVFLQDQPLDRLVQQGTMSIMAILDRNMQKASVGKKDDKPNAESLSHPDVSSLPALRVGVIEGHSYGAALNQFIARHEVSDRLIKLKNAITLAESLDRGDIEVAFLDHVVHQMFVSAGFYRHGYRFGAEPLHQAPTHIAFSKATVPQKFIQKVAQSLASIPDFFADHVIVATVIEPWVIKRALMSNWFFWLDIIGTVAFAMSGIIIAREERYSLFGTFVLAALPAVGGGVVRDLLVNRHPIGILATPLYLSLLVGMILVAKALLTIHSWLANRFTMYSDLVQYPQIGRFWITPSFALEMTDAIGLAAFTVTGVSIAFTYQAYPLWIWAPLLAVLTSSGGGILRDTIRSYRRIPTLTTSLYAEISALCGLGMTLALLHFSNFAGISPDLVILATIIIAFTLRMLVVVLDIKPLRL